MHVFAIMHPYILYMPGSLYAICRLHRFFDGLRGWRMRSHAYSHVYYPWFSLADGRFILVLGQTLKARVCKGSIEFFKRIRFSLKAKVHVYPLISLKLMSPLCSF
ncbi:hypothetical protein OIU84_019970 [Salix udensis]|uniref:Uncharacterized protein n=1 Tax=Salix udensis TaxID=889485 RepID=A0AAD6L048_9ROSI|nr:hypothetical protein OIU84_019970 [Salix udensis]